MADFPSPDVVVVGAGIVGVASAYYLTQAGLRVILIDRESIASGTTGACQANIGAGAGTLSAHGWYRCAVDEWHLIAEKQPEVALRRTGTLLVADTLASSEALLAESRRLAAAGMACEIIDTAEGVGLGLASDLSAIAIEPETEQINPMGAAVALAIAASRRGCHLRMGYPILKIEARNGHVTAVCSERDRIATGNVVLAAGTWTAALARTVGIDLPIVPRKGHIAVLEPWAVHLPHAVVEFAYEASLGGGFGTTEPHPSDQPQVGTVVQQIVSGQLLVGSSREYVGFDLTVNRNRVGEIARRASRFIPSLGSVRVLRTYAGLRPTSPDGLPLVGSHPALAGLLIAAGHGGGGITGGPLTGRLIADIVLNRQPIVDPLPLAPWRFDLAS